MKYSTMKASALLAFLATFAEADIYMHSPRGSNNRNCRSDNNKERRNANRLFDSQNNDNGGYNCERAWPFDCYTVIDDDAAFAACQAKNENPTKDMIDENGRLTHPDAIHTPMMYYYSGSILPVEYTVQHGMGTNDEVHSNVVIQYTCEDMLQDDCGAGTLAATEEGQCGSPFFPKEGVKTCGPRDGTPVRVTDGDTQLNVEATKTIPENPEDQDDLRYGRHETYTYYKECRNRERNKGLFTADQNVNGNSARYTRQNPGGTRYGLECPEESEYYPYWHHSPWKDVAVIVENESTCQYYKDESQNVKPRNRCDCAGQCEGEGKQPNNKVACETAGFTWCEDPAHGIEPPECIVGAYNRQNHLGNTGGSSNANTYNWVLPQVDKPMKCVLRIRYNISTMDYGDVSLSGTSANNNKASPLADNDENEEASYLQIQGLSDNAKLGFAVNTDQFGRTFSDRSFMFEIRPAPTDGPCEGRKIHNLNVRGKRGNIVQAYPAVEYDFVPTNLKVATDECIHVQWTGTDYNPNRDGNNAEGGPFSPGNQNKDTKADRHNMAPIGNPGDNFPILDINKYNMFDTNTDMYKKLLFLDQKIDDPDVCWSYSRLQEAYNNRADREEYHQNCYKLSGQKTPYFDAGLLRPGETGVYPYMSTRDNNFSNRGLKARIEVVPGGLSTFGLAGVIAGAAAVVLGAGAFFVRRRRRSNSPKAGAVAVPTSPSGGKDGSSKPKGGMFAGGVTSFWKKDKSDDTVEAVHYHDAAEPGELSFKKGDKIRVLSRDASGWWEGEVNGERGVFPANYTNGSPKI